VTVIDAGVCCWMRPRCWRRITGCCCWSWAARRGRGGGVRGRHAPAPLERRRGRLSGRFAAAVLGTAERRWAAFVALDPSVLIAYLLN
jgi:hypothetical protein